MTRFRGARTCLRTALWLWALGPAVATGQRVDAGTGLITTVAGGGTREAVAADGGPATEASIGWPQGLVPYPDGGFAFSETSPSRLRRVAGGTGIITTVGGDGQGRFAGDGGPATTAGASEPFGVRNVRLAAFQLVKLNDVFASLGVERKDRTP